MHAYVMASLLTVWTASLAPVEAQGQAVDDTSTSSTSSSTTAGAAVDDPRAAFAEATKLYNKGEFAAAVELYAAIYDAHPVPELLFNLGQCHFGLEDYERALHHYWAFVRAQPDGPNVEFAMTRIREAEALVPAQRRREALAAAKQSSALEQRRLRAEAVRTKAVRDMLRAEASKERERRAALEAKAQLAAEQAHVEEAARQAAVARKHAAEEEMKQKVVPLWAGVVIAAGVGTVLLVSSFGVGSWALYSYNQLPPDPDVQFKCTTSTCE